MGMTAILFNGTEPFKQIVNTLSNTAQAVSEKKTF